MDLYLSLGSNLGDRAANLRTTVEELDRVFGPHRRISSVLETEAWGYESQNKFLNLCVLYRLQDPQGESWLDCVQILSECKIIEKKLGRDFNDELEMDGHRVYHDRPIDIDILFCGTERIRSSLLTIPHPCIAQRDFVLIPLRQIALPSLKETFPEYF